MDANLHLIPSALPSMFAADVDPKGKLWIAASVLPEQFYRVNSTIYVGQPEVALMHAVLEDALNCFWHGLQASRYRKRRLGQEAEEWFFSDEMDWPFSFLNICAVLNLEPQYIRKGLRHWYQQRPTQSHKAKRRATAPQRPLKIAA
jgi:hypothetical protein